jgi:hypothetical protein
LFFARGRFFAAGITRFVLPANRKIKTQNPDKIKMGGRGEQQKEDLYIIVDIIYIININKGVTTFSFAVLTSCPLCCLA